MNHIKIYNKLTLILLLMVFFTSLNSTGQENSKITTYDSPEHMVAAAKEIITEMPVDEFRDTYKSDNVFVIDVRTAEEFNTGSVPGAVNIPRGVLEFRMNRNEIWKSEDKNPPDKDDPIVVYCGTGARGALSAKSLMQLGYTNVKSLEGGWGAWQKSMSRE